VLVAAARVLGEQAEGQLRQVASVVGPVAGLSGPELLERVCTGLAGQRQGGQGDGSGTPGTLTPDAVGQQEVVVELVRPNGTSCHALGGTTVRDVRAAPRTWRWLLGTDLPQGRGDHGEHLLVHDEPLAGGWRLRVARDLSGDLELIFTLRGVMLGLSIVGGLAALGFGSVISRGGLRPVAALAEAAEHIARTQDLSVRIDVPDHGDRDEVTRLARAFDRMTSALAASRARQAQLVADAGHELRTPLTSLRTNIDLLLRAERSGRSLPAAQREALFEDVRSQLAELSQLAGELTVLSQDEPAPALERVRLDDVVRDAVQRVGPRTGERVLDVEAEPWELDAADAGGLERAVVNVLDNAIKFSPPASTVRVRLAGGVVTVDDEGPGVPAEHRSEVFARFWRGDTARALPGSGLGLAIVADTVARHGGRVRLDTAPGGGARVRLHLPGRPATDAPPHTGAPPHTDGDPRVVET
jgi:two-component system sensor histidine kinase MprB